MVTVPPASPFRPCRPNRPARPAICFTEETGSGDSVPPSHFDTASKAMRLILEKDEPLMRYICNNRRITQRFRPIPTVNVVENFEIDTYMSSNHLNINLKISTSDLLVSSKSGVSTNHISETTSFEKETSLERHWRAIPCVFSTYIESSRVTPLILPGSGSRP